jgi:hypothetical protein
MDWLGKTPKQSMGWWISQKTFQLNVQMAKQIRDMVITGTLRLRELVIKGYRVQKW